MQALLAVAAASVAFVCSYCQARNLLRTGSDLPVHIFLSDVIREGGHRLLTRIPRLLNPSYCSAYPIFLQWSLSFVPRAWIGATAVLLNPSVSAVQVLLLYCVAARSSALVEHVGWICAVMALTPQFFHTHSARNQGLSSRAIGIVLFFVLAISIQSNNLVGIGLGLLSGYLIWGSNTFAQQSLLLFGIVHGLVFGKWRMITGGVFSLGLFVLLHPRYGASYLLHTGQFVRAYATDLADVFVLRYRYSIWRDLVYDIWIRLHQSFRENIHYTYGNAVLIVVFLNPLAAIGAIPAWTGAGDALVRLCSEMAIGGLLLFCATSFRRTRFLGEPERYIEISTVFSTTAGVWYAISTIGPWAILVILMYYLVADYAQFVLGLKARRSAPEHEAELCRIAEMIRRENPDSGVRFGSNNEVVTKFMMTYPWSFARLWSAEQDYGGLRVREAFSAYPFAHKHAFERLTQMWLLNICVLDKANFPELYTAGVPDRCQSRILLETEHYRVYAIEWGG